LPRPDEEDTETGDDEEDTEPTGDNASDVPTTDDTENTDTTGMLDISSVDESMEMFPLEEPTTAMTRTWSLTSTTSSSVDYNRTTATPLLIDCGTGGSLSQTETSLTVNSFTCTYPSAGSYQVSISNPQILNYIDLYDKKITDFW
jgi:hypothetical protein